MTHQVSHELELPDAVSTATHLPAAADDGTTVPEHATSPSRIDLIFYDVDHSGPSYEARVFVDPDATADTPRDLDHGYVGSFFVFGHGGCYGDVDHCDIHQGTRDAYDVRPPHPLTPWTKTLIVPPEAIGLFTGESVSVAVVPVAFDGTPVSVTFKNVRLAAYAD